MISRELARELAAYLHWEPQNGDQFFIPRPEIADSVFLMSDMVVELVTRGGIGFGDVRFAPLVGAATAATSWTLLAWALVLGSLTGALVGLVRLALRRRGSFAYAPSILAGAYLAATVAWLTT